MNRAEDLFERIKKEGQNVIDELISTRKSEELFLDFKRSSDNGGGKYISQIDRNNFAKAISGFGNSEGGLVVWGVDCSIQDDGSDIPVKKHPIEDVYRFVSQLEAVSSGVTLPPHTGIENYPLKVGLKNEGFVISYIQASHSFPLQTIYNNAFYIRAGSNFVPTPYQVLAGMFGKRPQPNVYTMYTIGPAELKGNEIHIQTGFLLHNDGPGIAKNIFINTKIWSSPGKQCVLALDTPDLNNWKGGFSFGRFMSLISNTEFRLAPDAHAQPLILYAKFIPPFDSELKIEISCGCEGGPPYKGLLHSDLSQIQQTYEEFTKRQTNLDKNSAHEVAMKLLGRKASE